MVKIVVLLCQITTAPLQCTENTAQAMVIADHQDDGMSCQDLADALLKQVHKNPQIANRIMVACEKDGRPY